MSLAKEFSLNSFFLSAFLPSFSFSLPHTTTHFALQFQRDKPCGFGSGSGGGFLEDCFRWVLPFPVESGTAVAPAPRFGSSLEVHCPIFRMVVSRIDVWWWKYWFNWCQSWKDTVPFSALEALELLMCARLYSVSLWALKCPTLSRWMSRWLSGHHACNQVATCNHTSEQSLRQSHFDGRATGVEKISNLIDLSVASLLFQHHHRGTATGSSRNANLAAFFLDEGLSSTLHNTMCRRCRRNNCSVNRCDVSNQLALLTLTWMPKTAERGTLHNGDHFSYRLAWWAYMTLLSVFTRISYTHVSGWMVMWSYFVFTVPHTSHRCH